MSTVSTSFFTAAIASGFLRSSTIERLPALSWPNIVPAPSRCTGRLRMRSPSGDSILITSAPMSASNRLQCGPAMVVEKSRTRRPSSGLVCSVMRSPRYEDENDAAAHEDAADPFAEGRALLEDEARGDEGEDEFEIGRASWRERV